MENDFVPSRLLSRLIRYWWILVFFVILGGMTGLLVAHFHKAVYESQAVITTVADYSLTGEIDDWGIDQMYLAVGDTIGSSAVKGEILKKAEAAKLPLSEDEVLDSLTLDRQDSRWVMHVRSISPQIAQQLARFWSESAMQALTTMRSDAVASFELQQYANSLATCLQQSVVIEAASTVCNAQNFHAIQDELKKLADDPASQSASGSLLLLHSSFALTTEATLPRSPVLFTQNLSALAGMVAALIVGILFLAVFRGREDQKNGMAKGK